MPDAMEPQIYTGVWTNWSQGRILGQTITIPNNSGVVLIAVLALLVRWAGSHFWGILCFLLHYLRSTQASKDGLYYQQQALLRSRSSETSFLWRMWETSWAWRSSVPGSFRRNVPMAALALLNLVGFLAAGIFSTRVASTDSEGLIMGVCGWTESTADKGFDQWTASDFDAGDVLFVGAYNGYRQSQEYAATCYTRNFYNNSDTVCKRPTVPYIASTIDRNAECPFAPEMCSGAAFSIDSGRINSDTHLGINAAASDRVEVRKKVSCAPLPMNEHSTDWTTERIPGVEAFIWSDIPNDTYKYWNFGPSVYHEAPVSNFTFTVNNQSLFVNGLPYTFKVRTHYAARFNESGFYPIEPLNRTDADVSILILNNRVAYTGEVRDPFYRADFNVGALSANMLAGSWVSTSTLTGLACTEQYQFCNPAAKEETCTPLTSLFAHDLVVPDAALQLSPRQAATYRLLRSMIYFMRFNSFLEFLKNEILVASRLVYGSFGISTPLAPTFWHTEIENMFNLSLAGMQLNSIDHAAAPNVEVRPGLWVHDHIARETDADSLALCSNQRARAATHSSFSLPGLCMLIVFAAFIILLDLALPKMMQRVQTLSVHGTVARQAWEKDDVLSIQRAAMEGRGIGPWKQHGGSVPVTTSWDVKFDRDRVYGAVEESAYNSSYRATHTNDVEMFEQLTERKGFPHSPGVGETSPVSAFSRASTAEPSKESRVFSFKKTPSSSVFRIEDDGVLR